MNIKEEKSRITRQLILEAALALVQEEGIANFSMRSLARRTGYSPSGLYEYFAAKDEVLLGLMEYGGSILGDYLKRAGNKGNLRGRLEEICIQYRNFAEDNPRLYTVMFTEFETLRQDTQEPEPEKSPYGHYVQIILDGLKDANTDERGSRARAEQLAFSLWSLMHGMIMLRLTHLKKFAATIEKPMDFAVAAMLDGLGV